MTGRAALVLVTTSFPNKGDGSEAAGAFVSDLAATIARHVPVRIVAPGPIVEHTKWSPNASVFRYPAPDRALSSLKPWVPAHLPQIVRVLRAGAKATRSAVDYGPTGHILALWTLPSGYWARAAARHARIDYSVWALGSDIWSLGRVPIVRTVLRSVIQDAQHRYADGIKLGDDAARISGREFVFLPSTRRLDQQRTRPLATAPPYRYLFLGRWHPNKGIDLLLAALEKLRDTDWMGIDSIHIAGGGPLEDLVRQGVHKLQTAGRPIRLSGFLDQAQASSALAATDYLLLPSRIESIPVVFSDAMKMGLPVVSMPVGDLPGLIEGRGIGFLASTVTAAAFAAAISDSLTRPPCDSRAALQAMALQFDLDRFVVPEILRLLPMNPAVPAHA
jgi:glycosyltransferase involved in cell wall biosynthesis